MFVSAPSLNFNHTFHNYFWTKNVDCKASHMTVFIFVFFRKIMLNIRANIKCFFVSKVLDNYKHSLFLQLCVSQNMTSVHKCSQTFSWTKNVYTLEEKKTFVFLEQNIKWWRASPMFFWKKYSTGLYILFFWKRMLKGVIYNICLEKIQLQYQHFFFWGGE